MQRLIFMLVLLVLAACTSSPKRIETEPSVTPGTPTQARCIDCGVVEDIQRVTRAESAPAKKPALSGIVGGVVSKPATSKPATRYEILIRMLNGKKVMVTQTILSSGLRIGSKVRVSQGRILAVAP